MQVFIAHPRLVETGLDLLFAPTIIFYESGYSLHTLRQASRRSWRIGQRQPVRVKFLCYKNTMQAKCLRLVHIHYEFFMNWDSNKPGGSEYLILGLAMA